MSGRDSERDRRSWLSAVALLSFIPSFGAARLFTFFLPDVVVQSSGIHFHHFWYGLIMIAVAGWLGIAGPERLSRLAAVMYGVGGGLLADEVVILLTLSPSDYQSRLTYTAVVGILAVAGTTSLVLRYWPDLLADLKKVSLVEWVVFIGLFVLALPLIADLVGFEASPLGILIALVYRWKIGPAWNKSRKSLLAEAAGVLTVVVFLVLVAVVSGLILALNYGANPPSLLTFPSGLALLILADVMAGLFGGWVWTMIVSRLRIGTVC